MSNPQATLATPTCGSKGEMAKRLARCKEVLAGEMSASNLVLGLRFSCNDLDVVGEGTINNKRFLKVCSAAVIKHYNSVEISWPILSSERC